MNKTARQFAQAKALCRDVYEKKLADYGTSWRVMRPSSLTDQILIKARRIRSIEEKGENRIGEGIATEYVGIVNYAVMALIQLSLPGTDNLPAEEAMRLYDLWIERATALMADKNHDYDEAWRAMRVSSITDIILQKLRRTREIEDHAGHTLVSEGIDANYMDMIVYSLFSLIKLVVEPAEQNS